MSTQIKKISFDLTEDEHHLVAYRDVNVSPTRNRTDDSRMKMDSDLLRSVSQEGNSLRRDMNTGLGRLEAMVMQMRNDLKKPIDEVQVQVQRNQMEIRSFEEKMERRSKQIVEKDQKLKNYGLANILTAEDLRQWEPAVQKRVETGLVYATNQRQEGFAYAKLTHWNQRLFLSCIQDEEPPSSAYAIKRQNVTGRNPNLVFLDVASVMFKTRFQIRLKRNSKHALHFASLCTGELGYNFREAQVIWSNGVISFEESSFTRLSDSKLKELAHEVLVSEAVARPDAIGIVVAHCDERDNLQSFSLRVNGRPDANPRGKDYIIGSVEEGGNTWLGNIQEHVFSRLSIADCGTVLDRIEPEKWYHWITLKTAGKIIVIGILIVIAILIELTRITRK
ncbi:uncharacterized protein LOC134769919 isoform X3 [Penaeus indicus]|uniref:uncharacterized protein LOC134769919 isoform X3 n=1 Tax=Penaeus indicus TaxID=29960 RepID=UPI00300C91DC